MTIRNYILLSIWIMIIIIGIIVKTITRRKVKDMETIHYITTKEDKPEGKIIIDVTTKDR